MLFWRLSLGAVLVALLLGLAWLDYGSPRPGLIMSPLAIVGAFLAAGELVRMFEQDTDSPAPSRYVVVPGAVATVLVSCVPMLWPGGQPVGPISESIGRVGWVAIGLAGACSVAFTIEMLRYRTPGSATVRLALAVFSIALAGGLMGFVVQLRMLGGGPWGADGHWGMLALLSVVIVVKSNDTGAYFTGKLIGRTQLAPALSPGKTREGLLGGFLFSALVTMLVFGPMATLLGCEQTTSGSRWVAGCLLYSLIVGIAGVAGDLAVSLLKRDSGVKNSSSWMPGFGGVLDLLDSILFAAPVAYLLWIARCVGP